MSKVEDFLSKAEEEDIVKAIQTAEAKTSGEIRIHIEKNTSLPVLERAKEVFHFLKMDTTKQKNGVLIYVAVESHLFAIYGDQGINNVVPDDFWNTTRDAIKNQFKLGNFKQGLIDGILKAGDQLQQHFPWNEDDVNELPNTISRG